MTRASGFRTIASSSLVAVNGGGTKDYASERGLNDEIQRMLARQIAAAHSK